MEHVEADWTLEELPAHKWKMRMQLAAPWFADLVIARLRAGQRFDAILCSTFIDLAVFRALLGREGVPLGVRTSLTPRGVEHATGSTSTPVTVSENILVCAGCGTWTGLGPWATQLSLPCLPLAFSRRAAKKPSSPCSGEVRR